MNLIKIKNQSSSSTHRYIYGFDLDFDLEHLHQTFTAGDKYLVHHFTDAVLEYTKNKLDVSNCCMVYDQVLKLPQRTPLLRQAAKLIQEHSREAFRSAYFIRIDQHTLISMLKLPKLNVKEIDILRFCSQWVDAQASWCGLPASKENRQAIFEPIKYFIRFDVITDIDKVKDLLLESDFIHFTGKFGASKKVAVKCLTKRRAFNAKTNRTKANESRLKQPTENQVSIQIDLNQPDAIQPNLATNESTLFSEILVDMCKVAIFVLILVCMALFLLVCASSISHPKRSDAFIPF